MPLLLNCGILDKEFYFYATSLASVSGTAIVLLDDYAVVRFLTAVYRCTPLGYRIVLTAFTT